MFTREGTSSIPVPETQFNGSEGERLGQLVVTPEVGETGVGCHTGWLSHCQYLIR